MKPGSATDLPQPWLEDALEQLDLRRDDRCLVLTCPTEAHVAAVSHAVGRSARIVVVEPDPQHARAAAAGTHDRLEVLAYEPEGTESFGIFDALLACPLTTMGWEIATWAELLVRNLRPGGRFVLDLPGENLCDPLTRTWARIGGDPSRLASISGPSEAELAAALRRRGLRSVAASMGTHLATLESPYVLGALLAGLGCDAERRADLELALVETMRTTGPVDVVFHRTRVHGLR